MSWEFVGRNENCMTLVHDDGYLLHGTRLTTGGDTTWIVEVTDAASGTMIEQNRHQVEDRSELEEILERYRETYPEPE